MHFFSILTAVSLFTLATLLAGVSAAAEAGSPLTTLEAFQQTLSPTVAARLETTPKHYRQIEPSLYYLAATHGARLESLTPEDQVETLVKLARFIDARRAAAADRVVIGKGRDVIGLLDPDRGLDPREVTTIARAYNAASTNIFKQDGNNATIQSVGDDFLAAVSRAAHGDAPTTIIVLGHGLPEEIQSYAIPCDRLADAFLPPSDPPQADLVGESAAVVDLSHVVLVCDDCYSADFSINLAAAIEKKCREQSLRLTSLPVMIAGTNRNCVGHADFGAKFVPHFWKDVIELYYIRRPRQATITLRDFFEKVDNMMYGYGRAPRVNGDGTVSYRLVDPELCQDPVVFVPLSDDDLAELRTILGLPADAPLPRLFDIG
jgi:hypothetical protein